MKMSEDKQLDNLETIKNLMILSLIHQGVTPEAIAKATGVAPITIRKNFPMKDIKKKASKP